MIPGRGIDAAVAIRIVAVYEERAVDAMAARGGRGITNECRYTTQHYLRHPGPEFDTAFGVEGMQHAILGHRVRDY